MRLDKLTLLALVIKIRVGIIAAEAAFGAIMISLVAAGSKFNVGDGCDLSVAI